MVPGELNLTRTVSAMKIGRIRAETSSVWVYTAEGDCAGRGRKFLWASCPDQKRMLGQNDNSDGDGIRSRGGWHAVTPHCTGFILTKPNHKDSAIDTVAN